ncbi:MAG: hypothetical protein ACJ78K_13355 [Gemmatimonadaceae bacterium]
MMDKKNDTPNEGSAPDTEESLEKELSREAAEGADSIGDIASNRTLSGSSSWETLPDGDPTGGRAAKSEEESGQSPETPNAG